MGMIKYHYMTRIDLTGKRFGRLMVTGYSHTGKTKSGQGRTASWFCSCDCGTTIVLTGRELKSGNTASCGCGHKAGKTNTAWKGCGELSGLRFSQIRKCAEKRNKPFNVTIEYCWQLLLAQDKKCALSGEPIALPLKKGEAFTASLDCINPELGYVEGNLQWLHRNVNQLKWDQPTEKFLFWIKKVYTHNFNGGLM